MVKRLHERFYINQPVEIFFPQIQRWIPGRVVRFDPPGVWVESGELQRWFVTNGRRIRSLEKNVDE
ncbi:MAG: hypothetical protein QNJ45_14240 [Ardenticatenaceae bacterium]|nr:hypothetical protein [Ardenticatenaceae bacterium]